MSLSSRTWIRIALMMVLAGITMGAHALWQALRPQSEDERYRVQVVEPREVTQTVSANGTLNPVVLVNVGTQVSGTVKKLHADYNDRVKQGQLLVELDDALFRAQVQQSEANLRNAQAAFEMAAANEARARDLHRQGFISAQGFDQAVQALRSARAQLALAQAQLQKDRTNLAYTLIRSPVSGVVIDRQVDVGQTVAANFQTPTLFRIAQDLRKMQIDSSVAEADVGQIEVGQPVRFKVDAFPDRSFHGKVRLVRLNPVTQQNVVTYDAVVAVDNPEMMLLPGMTAYVNIVVARRKGVLVVPNAALRFKPAQSVAVAERPAGGGEKREASTGTVYVLEDGDLLRLVNIVMGITDNRYTEVVSGDLKAGDKVVYGDLQASAAATHSRGIFRIGVF